MQKNNFGRPSLRSSFPEKDRVNGNRDTFLSIKFRKSITATRYLLSKLVYTYETFTEIDAAVLFSAFEDVVKKCAADKAFKDKYYKDLTDYSAIFVSLGDLSQRNNSELRTRLVEIINKIETSEKFACKSYYYIVRGNVENQIKTKVSRRFPKVHPPKPFIGIGYGDNGTAKDLCKDASPTWQEVAVTNCNEDNCEILTKIDQEFLLFAEFSTIARGQLESP